MPYVNVPNDLSKIKTKIAFNLTKRQLICFGAGAAIGVPTYLLTRQAIGNTGALFATAVSASSRLAVRIIIVILGFGFFDLTLLCVPHDHLIDLTQHFRRQALAEIHHQRRVKGQLFVIIARIPAEILKIWVFLDLERGFLVRIAILRLNDAGTQGQTQRLGHIAFPVGE